MAIKYERMPRVGNCLLYMGLGMNRKDFPRDSAGFEPLEAYFPKMDYNPYSSDSGDSVATDELVQQEMERRRKTRAVVPQQLSPPHPSSNFVSPASSVGGDFDGTYHLQSPVLPLAPQGGFVGVGPPVVLPPPGGGMRYSPEQSVCEELQINSRLAPSKLSFSSDEGDMSAEETVENSSGMEYEAVPRQPSLATASRVDLPFKPTASAAAARKEVTVVMDATGASVRLTSDFPALKGRGHPQNNEGMATTGREKLPDVVGVAHKARPPKALEQLQVSRSGATTAFKRPHLEFSETEEEEEEEDEVSKIVSGLLQKRSSSRFLCLKHLSRVAPEKSISVAEEDEDEEIDVSSVRMARRTATATSEGSTIARDQSSSTEIAAFGSVETSNKQRGKFESKVTDKRSSTGSRVGGDRGRKSGTKLGGNTSLATTDKGRKTRTSSTEIITKVVETSTVVRSRSRRDTSVRRSGSSQWFVPPDISISKIRQAAKAEKIVTSPRRLRSKPLIISSDEEDCNVGPLFQSISSDKEGCDVGASFQSSASEAETLCPSPRSLGRVEHSRSNSGPTKKNVTFSTRTPGSDSDTLGKTSVPSGDEGDVWGFGSDEGAVSGGEDAVVEGGASGGFVGSAGGHVSRETSESDSDFMPRLKRRWKGREHTHTSPQRTNPAPKGEKRKRGRPRKMGNPSPVAVPVEVASPSPEGEKWGWSRKAGSPSTEVANPSPEGERKEWSSPAAEVGPVSSEDERVNFEVVKTPGGRKFRRLEVARPANPTPGVRRSKRARVPPVEPDQKVEYDRRRRSGVTLTGILVPVDREPGPRATEGNPARPLTDESFPLLNFEHTITGDSLTAKVMHTRNSAYKVDGCGRETKMDSDSVVIQKVYSDDSGCSLGYISFPPNSVKENCSNDYYDMFFTVIKGNFLFTINEEHYESSTNKGIVKVPSGTFYSITNLKNSRAEIFYTAFSVVAS